MKRKFIAVMLISLSLVSSVFGMDAEKAEVPFDLNWMSQKFNLNIDDVETAYLDDCFYKIEFKQDKEEEVKIFGADLISHGCTAKIFKNSIWLGKSIKEDLLDAHLDSVSKLAKVIANMRLRYGFSSRGLPSNANLNFEEKVALAFVELFEGIYPHTQIIYRENNKTRDMSDSELSFHYGMGNFRENQIAHQIIDELSSRLKELLLLPKIEELFSNQNIKEKIKSLCPQKMLLGIEIFLKQTKSGNSIYGAFTSFSLGTY